MLTIRKEQVEKLGEYITETFVLNTIKQLREKYTRETNNKDDNNLLDFIHHGIEKAEKHNIIERRDIVIYLEYMLIYGEDFDTDKGNKWAIKVFRIKNLTGEEKIIQLLKKKPL